MKYLVLVKVVKGELSPFDEAALECALTLRESYGGEIIAATMAPESACYRMRALTRLGIERSVVLCDSTFAGSDTAATSYVLALAAKRLLGDERDYLILCGRQSMDGDTAQVGVSVGTRLGIPVITNAMTLPILAEREITVDTRLGVGKAELPALVTCERIAKLRFASMRSRPHEIERLDADSLGADRRKCGLEGSPTKVLRSFESSRGRRSCVFLPREEFLAKLVELANAPIPEPASEQPTEISEAKFPEIYAVGDEVAKIADSLAERVVRLDRLEADEYVRLFAEKKPPIVLFPADLWGRRIAPEVATRLETGLCADCTRLETDGERLFMYRPAFGGSITAKIICRTNPQMATVRVASESSDVIVSAGLGVRDCPERVRELERLLGALPGASRGLVDAGLAPYEHQVGITGRTVAPKLYVALGISGAVHHTAAIEGSRYIAAMNPDKNARIFDFCDFGCVDEL